MSEVMKMYNEEVLMTEEPEALKSLYRQLIGTEPHHKMGKNRMVIEILSAQEMQQKPQPHVAPPAKPETKVLTQDEILEALQPQIARGLKVSFDQDGWLLRNGVAMDSGNYTVPLGLIREIANGLLRARLPAKVKIDGVEAFA